MMEQAPGRQTFYRNFELREDVIDCWLDLRCTEYEKNLLSVPLEEMLQYHCAFLKKYTSELITLYQNGLHPMVEKKFSIFLPDTMPLWSEDPVEQEYRSQYIIKIIISQIKRKSHVELTTRSIDGYNYTTYLTNKKVYTCGMESMR